jgi:glycerol 3-phosphatase-1
MRYILLNTLFSRHGKNSLNPRAPTDSPTDVCAAEAQIPKDHGSDATEIPGSRALLSHLETLGAPWAIVTSGTRGLVTGWLDVMKLAHPRFMVTAEEVSIGKPDPACYRLGAERLGFALAGQEDGKEGKEFLVLEDAPAGVRAGKNAGFRVVALATTHGVEELRAAGADWIVRDMRSVTVERWDAKGRVVGVRIADALV